MLSNIAKAMPGASIAQIASVYHDGEAKKVSDYGARVQAIYNEKPWRKPPPAPSRMNPNLFGL